MTCEDGTQHRVDYKAKPPQPAHRTGAPKFDKNGANSHREGWFVHQKTQYRPKAGRSTALWLHYTLKCGYLFDK